MKNALPSKKQHALLEFIDRFIAENNYAPSYREVMRALGYKSVSTVATHVNGLIERGWLVKRENEKRSLEVVYKEGQSGAQNSPAPSLSSAHSNAPHVSPAELLSRLGSARERVEVGGAYEHYKGGVYTVVDLAIQTGDEEVCVVYRADYGSGIMYTRPLNEWLDTVSVKGEAMPRFKSLAG